ncbi:MFS transporter [Paraburkholderia sp. SEWSISQ10-3 4]|uniref:MFS transporter n=1 Tax=Paraburkholderia TaxID=1822464 RepID=UPI00190A378A|nr:MULTISPECIES: MFS transporter [Paraburkholderia]MCX4140268.1 MFS transporter [Paraburkholderia aspalathi]MDN7172955.1 MFS transporter [Paraburkholderia sp. SEWSISQ10-3 4]MDQ6502594.1 MFS transporter [Paraburkholderia aspalathi]CAE6772454.1 Proline/betaine transporter [Paraburkholderia aspalathi]CAE6796450.1 Proline/betaine transporter [Paraburkholderia aspalathi]
MNSTPVGSAGIAVQRTAMSRNDIKTLTLASLGGALEYYDFIVAVFFTKLLATVFFPEHTPEWLAQLEVFCIFAAGYLVRPIGGVFFAHFGDRIGRKKMFSLSLFLMAAPTLLIGLLPSYATFGIGAPLLFLLCRVLQGLSVGGEVPGAWIFCSEHVRRDRVGLACGLLMAGLCLGILLGSLSAKYLLGNLAAGDLKAWGWRMPFIAGGVFGLISVYLRRYLHETPVFEALRVAREADKRLPLAVVLTEHRRALVISGLATWVFSGVFVLYFLYTPTFLQSQFHIEAKEVFANNSWAIFGLIVGSVVAGVAADRIGGGRAYTIGCVAMLVICGAFYLTLGRTGGAVWPLYIAGGFLIGTITLGPYIIVKSFPAEVRFTGFALSYNTAYALFGGTAPAIASFLVGKQGLTMAPAWYLAALCVLGAVVGVVWKSSVDDAAGNVH